MTFYKKLSGGTGIKIEWANILHSPLFTISGNESDVLEDESAFKHRPLDEKTLALLKEKGFKELIRSPKLRTEQIPSIKED